MPKPSHRSSHAMRRSLPSLVLLVSCLTACLDRTRVNSRCEWSPDSLRALDSSNWLQQRHLYADVELAEELAIRYADAKYKERTSFYGHGGLIDGGRLRDSCMASLVRSVAQAHSLTAEQVERARARGYRNPLWDAGVLLSFVGIYGLLAWLVAGQLTRRIPPEEDGLAIIAPLLLSLPIGILAYQFFAIWGGALETCRLGNGHVSSYRSAKPPWPQHSVALVTGAVVVFLIVAAARRLMVRRSATPGPRRVDHSGELVPSALRRVR